MENSYQESEMNQKIPIKITWVENEDGISEPEIVLDAEDYFDFEGSMTDALIKFKKEYSMLIKKTRSLKYDPKKGQMKKVWTLGRELSKFNERARNQFIILNEQKAFARDLGLSISYIRFFINFSTYFTKSEVPDEMSGDHCRTFCDHARKLKKLHLFDKEKKELIQNVKNKELLPYHKYRLYLNKITSQTIAE